MSLASQDWCGIRSMSRLKSNSWRTALIRVTPVLILLLLTGALHASTRDDATARRVVVKLKPEFAKTVEAEIPADVASRQMQVARVSGGIGKVQGFLARHSARQISALYPEIIRARKQWGWSDAEFADHLRQRFSKRAHRAKPAAIPELSRTYVIEFGSAEQREKAVRSLKADPNIEYVEPVHTFSSKQLTDDPFASSSGTWGQPYPDLWGLISIGAPEAWDVSMGDGVVIGVVDTGIDYNHPDLAANIWINPNEVDGNWWDDDGNGYVDDVRGYDFVFNRNDPVDRNGHGTHVAGTIAAVGNNGIGVVGVAPHARVMAVKGLDDGGFGYDFTLAPAIVYAAENGADIINASWGGPESSQSIEEAIQFATGIGVVFVAAAGNSGQDASSFYPANSPEAITVAASDPFGNLSWFSNFGPKVDVTAPGMDILSLQAAGTFLGPLVSDGYLRLDGTSMAAPHVSGVAALALSQHPTYSTEQIRQVVRSSASPGNDSRFGYGKLNAASAVAVTDPLESRISALQFGASPLDPITISGVAQGNGFASYMLEYGFGADPFSWTPFYSSSSPAAGTLGMLDPSMLFGGTYTIRLTAFNATGAAFVDKRQFTLVLTKITSPLPGNMPTSVTTYKPGYLLPITGTAIVPSFQNFVVEWATGQNPSSGWQSDGITLTSGGLSPVGNSQLATWDTSVVTRAGYYTIRLTVNGATVSQATTAIYLEPDLLSVNWPVFVDQGPYFNSGVIPARNADGTLRLVMQSPNVGNTPAASWAFGMDGSVQKTPLDLYGSFHQPAVGDLDGIPGDEAVMPDFNVVKVFHPNNSSQIFTTGLNVDLTINPLLLEDLNNNFELDTIAVGLDHNTNLAYVLAWKPDGQQLPGFPVQVQDQNPLKNWYNHVRVLAGDFDGDGSKEVLVQEGLTPTTYTLRLFGSDGRPKSWNAPVLTGMPFAMAAADLDHNGKLETILVGYNGTQAMLHVLQPDGSERAGWPVDVSSSNQFAQAFLAVGDLNRDGKEEIVLSHETSLFVFNADGSLFSNAWPLSSPALGFGAVVIGDVDGDGFPEIVTPRTDLPGYYDAKLLAIHSDGTIARSWQLTGSHGLDQYAYPAPAIGDFDQNGTTDIAVAYEVTGANVGIPGVVTILDTHAPFSTAQNDWPLMLQNQRDSAILLRPSASNVLVTSSDGSVESTVGQTVTFIASIAPATGTGSIQFFDGPTAISAAIPLSNGAASFTAAGLSLGTHSISARYTGSNLMSASESALLAFQVVKGNASIDLALTGGTNPSVAGDPVAFTARVSPQSATGTVIFFDHGTAISGDIPLVDGAASFSISSLFTGSHAISALYSGDATFDSAASTNLVQVVNAAKASSSVIVTTSANPSAFGSAVTFVATVTPASATGLVTFFDAGISISSVQLVNGVATFTTNALVAGNHIITAQYAGDENLNPSTSAALTQSVLKANPGVTLKVAESSSGYAVGTPLTFIAIIDPVTATGTAMFFDGPTALSDGVPLVNGSASFTTSSLSEGTHSISVRYSGDSNFTAASSNTRKIKIK